MKNEIFLRQASQALKLFSKIARLTTTKILKISKLISNSENIFVGNFALVKFLASKKEIFYVGQITSLQDEEYEIKFLRRKRNTNSFLFPTVEDISVVQKKDIAAVLPSSSSHGIARTSSVFKFNVNFSNINVR